MEEGGGGPQHRVEVAGAVVKHGLAVGKTVILLHHPLPLAGVSIAMERERQQNDSLVFG